MKSWSIDNIVSAKIIVKPGELPKFWDQNVIFFVNLHSLFFSNEGLTKVLEEEVSGLPTYGGRVLPILGLIFQGENNLAILEAAPEPTIMEYAKSDLGLQLPKYELFEPEKYAKIKPLGQKTACFKPEELVIKNLKKHPARHVDGFVTDETLASIAKHLGKETVSSFDGSKRGNNKLLFHNYIEEKGFPIFDTCLASNPKEVLSCLKELEEKGYHEAVLKAQIGASGCGLSKHYITTSTPDSFPEYFFFEGPCLVQGWLDDRVDHIKYWGSPSCQLFLNDNSVFLYDLTEQLLSTKHVHEGNIAPPPYFKQFPQLKEEMLSQASVAGEWLHKQGYRGTAGIDYLVVEKRGKLVVIMNEINARITGATYPSVLARHFIPHGGWIMRNIKFSPTLPGPQILSRLDKAGLLFKKGKEQGILPFNFNLDYKGNVHKGQFLFIDAKVDVCTTLLNSMLKVFQDEYRYDRD